MFWKLLRSVRGLTEDRLFCCLYAAFLNESINREIITGRNLEPGWIWLNGSWNRSRTYIILPLIVVTKKGNEDCCIEDRPETTYEAEDERNWIDS